MQLPSEFLLNESTGCWIASRLITVFEEAGVQTYNTRKPHIFERESITQTDG